jgi:hypothetical protein
VTTGGTISEFAVLTAISIPSGIAAGPDGALWFTESNANKIGRVTTDAGPPGPAGATGTTGTAGTNGANGTNGASGPAGPAGPAGPSGSAGPAGAPGALVLFAFQALSARTKVTVRYVLTARAPVTLSVKPSRGPARTVARASGHAGLNQIAWNRKLGRKAAKRGTYKLTVTTTNQGRHTASTITIRLR